MKNQWIKLMAAGFFLTGCIGRAGAQDQNDALRFSMLQPQGTARSIGFGSALGSVGGDFTSLSINPAGLGIYRKSEFVVTPSLMFNNVSSNYVGATQTDNGSHFSFSNLGFVFSKAERGRRYEASPWKSVSFGVGLNRLADFTRDYHYSGLNNTSSGSEVFAADANNPLDPNRTDYLNNPENLDPSTPGFLGYQSFLIGTDSGRTAFGTYTDYSKGLTQLTTMKERGGISELVLSLGGNYKEKLMIGGTLGLPVLRYVQNKTFREQDMSGDNNNNFDNFTYRQDLTTNGTGVNFKLGFIYKPVEYFRIGAAIHTPTYYSLTDVTNASVISNTENLKSALGYTDGPVSYVTAQERQYQYNLTTPWRAIASATAMLGSYGFFTVDYEYVNYAAAHFSFASADAEYQDQVNNSIKNSYRGASNIRTGIEIKLQNFALRGGFGYYGNPYKSNIYADGQRLDFSAGLGFRMPHSFVDLGFVHHQYKNAEQPYSLPAASYPGVIVPTSILNTGQNNFAATLGWKF